MSRDIGVYCNVASARVGTLRFDARGHREAASFEYDAAWLAQPERFAIAPSVPLVDGAQFHKRAPQGSPFHDPLADTEPDGWAKRVILRDHAKRRQQGRQAGDRTTAPALTSLDFLLAVDDTSRVGALRLQDESGQFCRAHDPDHRTTPPLVELGALLAASRAVEQNTESLADLAYLRGRGTSLGGLRPKCTVIDDDGALSIGKFPSATDERAVTKGEVLALRLARRAGIDAAEARLLDSEGQAIALVRRFDRTAETRTPYVSAATLLGVDSSGEHAYTQVVDAIRAHGANVSADVHELYRRIAFSILITNTDDHLHNLGFLHVEHGQWRLAPAFDLNPAPDRVRELKTWISEETGPAASIESLRSVATYYRLSLTTADAIIAEVDHAVASWRRTGAALGMTMPELETFADAFEHEERLGRR